MMISNDDVEFNGYYVRVASKKNGISPTSLHYWISVHTHTKHKEPLTLMTIEEDKEVVVWCKQMVGFGHGMELIQLKSIATQICQVKPNPFRDGFLGKS